MQERIVDGRYRLERQLGHSSMGEVWLAHDLELERPVALKLLAPDAERARFERKARATAALGHPNVTRLYDCGEADGRPYMALEYLPGGTLEERHSDDSAGDNHAAASDNASAYHRDRAHAPHDGRHHHPAESLTVGSES